MRNIITLRKKTLFGFEGAAVLLLCVVIIRSVCSKQPFIVGFSPMFDTHRNIFWLFVFAAASQKIMQMAKCSHTSEKMDICWCAFWLGRLVYSQAIGRLVASLPITEFPMVPNTKWHAPGSSSELFFSFLFFSKARRSSLRVTFHLFYWIKYNGFDAMVYPIGIHLRYEQRIVWTLWTPHWWRLPLLHPPNISVDLP